MAATLWSAVAGVGALAWMWLPPGFPVLHPRFVVNVLAPASLVLLGVVGLACTASNRPAWEARVGAAALALSFAVAGTVLFGRSGALAACIAAPTGLAFLVAARESMTRHPHRSIAAALLAAALGAGAAWGLRAPEPSTMPLGAGPDPGQPAQDIEVDCGRLALRIDATLRIDQPSRSRFWSAFATDDARGSVGAATLVSRPDGFEAQRTLSEPVYAHLASFTRIDVYRAKSLSIRFARGSRPIDVLPSDYPEGRPLRFAAWIGEALIAYQATSAEKGPFHALATTPLRRGDPLVLELLDGNEPQCRVTLLDFTAQASTELSPTAGFGLPQNAIELLASEHAPVQSIVFSLAATSVGRGWDTVGHAAGTYRNRLRVE